MRLKRNAKTCGHNGYEYYKHHNFFEILKLTTASAPHDTFTSSKLCTVTFQLM